MFRFEGFMKNLTKDKKRIFKTALSKTMSEAFCVTLFNGSCDNDGSKKQYVFIGR